ncbi:MAG: hypothetical protein ACTHKT_12660 [Solirubrobacterales bacterium]
MLGGPSVSHPLKAETIHELEELGGPSFASIRASASVKLDLPLYTPQARNERALSGYLHGDIYFLRISAVLRKDRILSAEELRDRLGLTSRVRLFLLMFDRDRILEVAWERGLRLVEQIAAAGYVGVICPSFSTYWPRPATEFLINSKRSLIYFSILQSRGVRAIPRVAWITAEDAIRFGLWIQENPLIGAVALDLSTYRRAEDWRDQMEGLELFDRLTGERLTYLINGASVERRCLELFTLLGVARTRITNATTQARIKPRRLRSTDNQVGITFAARQSKRQGAVETAAAQFEEGQRLSWAA